MQVLKIVAAKYICPISAAHYINCNTGSSSTQFPTSGCALTHILGGLILICKNLITRLPNRTIAYGVCCLFVLFSCLRFVQAFLFCKFWLTFLCVVADSLVSAFTLFLNLRFKCHENYLGQKKNELTIASTSKQHGEFFRKRSYYQNINILSS